MIRDKRLAELLLQATNNLKKAVKAKMKGDYRLLSEKVWEIGADLEYLLFIISLSRENSNDLWKENVKTTRTVDIDYELTTIQSLLKEASSSLEVNLEECYMKMWFARGCTLRVQRTLERTTAK